MLRIDNELNFSMIQGDNGGVEFFLSCYDIKEDDIIEFICYKGSQQFFKKTPVLLKDGIVYFYIESSETINIPIGEQNYDIIINIKEFNRDETIINNKKFIVMGGVNYAK